MHILINLANCRNFHYSYLKFNVNFIAVFKQVEHFSKAIYFFCITSVRHTALVKRVTSLRLRYYEV